MLELSPISVEENLLYHVTMFLEMGGLDFLENEVLETLSVVEMYHLDLIVVGVLLVLGVVLVVCVVVRRFVGGVCKKLSCLNFVETRQSGYSDVRDFKL